MQIKMEKDGETSNVENQIMVSVLFDKSESLIDGSEIVEPFCQPISVENNIVETTQFEISIKNQFKLFTNTYNNWYVYSGSETTPSCN